MVIAQLGLLEDDIVYRLALLCVNILQPLKNRYPNIVVVSGFRETNSGIGQHELGEAVDIQIRNQTASQLYEVADYIAKNLQFDQLVLNFTNIGDGQPWIHVSFSPESLRRQVLTKDFADTFHEGLFLITPLSGEEQASVLREQASMDKLIAAELMNLQNRQTKLTPVFKDADPVPADVAPVGGGPGGGGGTPPGKSTLPNYKHMVAKIYSEGTYDLKIKADCGRFTHNVCVAMHAIDENFGHIAKSPGQNRWNTNGRDHAVDAIMHFETGEVFDIIGSNSSPKAHFIWHFAGYTDKKKWYAP